MYDDYYSTVDLYKEDSDYESVDAIMNHSWLDYASRDAGWIFDSAVRTGGGGCNKWTYIGLSPKHLGGSQLPVHDSPTIVQTCV